MTGRPTIRTQAMIDEIVDRLTTGEPLAKILRDEGMPKPSTWYRWCEDDATLSGEVARAREFGADAIAVDALEIADDSTRDFIIGKDGPTLDSEHVQRSKLRIETRLKLLRCWDPKRYGDRLEVDNKGEIAVNVAVRRFTPELTHDEAAETEETDRE